MSVQLDSLENFVVTFYKNHYVYPFHSLGFYHQRIDNAERHLSFLKQSTHDDLKTRVSEILYEKFESFQSEYNEIKKIHLLLEKVESWKVPQNSDLPKNFKKKLKRYLFKAIEARQGRLLYEMYEFTEIATNKSREQNIADCEKLLEELRLKEKECRIEQDTNEKALLFLKDCFKSE